MEASDDDDFDAPSIEDIDEEGEVTNMDALQAFVAGSEGMGMIGFVPAKAHDAVVARRDEASSTYSRATSRPASRVPPARGEWHHGVHTSSCDVCLRCPPSATTSNDANG